MFSKSQEAKDTASDGPTSPDQSNPSHADDRKPDDAKEASSQAGFSSPAQTSGGDRPDSSFRSVIGQELAINGNVTAEGPVQLDGQIEGNVHCVAITVGESGLIKGNVMADEVEVSGRVIGDIHGKKVQLHARARVKGDINHSVLTIEQGALFEGQSRPSNMSEADMDKPRSAANSARAENQQSQGSERESSKKSEQPQDLAGSKSIKAVT
jgi:cytoskeletal protein CcmA (bactofilin family)